MRGLAAFVTAAVGALSGAAYLAVVARYGPSETCRGAVSATFSRGTTRGEFTVLRCSDYAGEAHRLMAVALACILFAGALLMLGWRTSKPRNASAEIPLPGGAS